MYYRLMYYGNIFNAKRPVNVLTPAHGVLLTAVVAGVNVDFVSLYNV